MLLLLSQKQWRSCASLRLPAKCLDDALPRDLQSRGMLHFKEWYFIWGIPRIQLYHTSMCIHVDIKDSLFFKVDSYSWYFFYQGKCWSETKAGNYIYVGVSNTSSMHYVSEGMVEANGSAPSGKQSTGILIID